MKGVRFPSHSTLLRLTLLSVFLFLESLALAQAPVMGEATGVRAETALARERCLDEARHILSDWGHTLDDYFAVPSSPKHILNRFRSVKKEHSKALDALVSLSRFDVPAVVSSADFTAALDDLRNRRSKVNDGWQAARRKDEGFLWLSAEAERSLVDLTTRLHAALAECPEATRSSVQAQEAIATQHRKEVALARKYVSNSAAEREKSLALTYEKKKADLLSKHAKATGTSLQVVRRRYEGALILGDLLPEFAQWKLSRISKGYGNGEITFYSQFEAGLDGIASDIQVAQGYRSRIDAVQGVGLEVKAKALQEVDAFISDQVAMRDKHLRMGWQGHLESQRFLARAMLKIAEKYSASCVAMLEVFERDTALVKDLVEYREHESFYKQTIRACRSDANGGAS